MSRERFAELTKAKAKEKHVPESPAESASKRKKRKKKHNRSRVASPESPESGSAPDTESVREPPVETRLQVPALKTKAGTIPPLGDVRSVPCYECIRNVGNRPGFHELMEWFHCSPDTVFGTLDRFDLHILLMGTPPFLLQRL